MDHPNEERAAESLWSRFRDIAMALRRLQDFNFSAEGAEGRFTERWLEGLIRDEGVLAGVGRELVLRAFRAGAEAINFEILRRLRGGDAVAVSHLADATGLPHFTVSERINDLMQVGLAVRVIEQDAVRPTPLTDAFLGMVEEIERRLTAKIRERLPGLIGP
jgi:hypothetical protein